MSTVKTNITELPDSRVRVDAEVAADEVERRVQETARQLGRQMRIPGFRKGKVPPPVVIRRLGRDAVLDQAVENSIPSWYVDAIDGSGITPVGRPKLQVGDLPGQGQPLSFTIEIGVRPKAKLGQYKGLEVGRREPQVEDAALDERIEQMRDRFATLETVERGAAQGDHVVVDYVGKVDGEAFEGGTGRDQLLELGAGRLVPGFEEQLIGAQAGDERVVEVTFPEGYPGGLGGQRAQFDVTIHEVKAKRLPELDDDFATDAGGFDTVDELREDVRRQLTEEEAHRIEHEFEAAVLEAAVSEAELDVPEELIHARAHELLEDTFRSLARRGISKETYLQITDRDEETLAHEAQPEAAEALRREAVLAAVVEAENIEPSDEDVLEALQPTAEREGRPAPELLDQLRSSGGLEPVRDEVAGRQAVELLVREAQPISIEQAKARKKLWTPGKEPQETGPAHPSANPSASPAGQLWTPGQ